MPLKAAVSNSDNVFSTIRLIFKGIVDIKVFEQKAEVNFLLFICLLYNLP